MAKKFVRSITGIKNIQDQDLSTNNVGDLLSDGKDIYVHRKNGNKEEYFNLTEEKKNPTDIVTPDGKGLTSWKDGDTTNVTLSEEFLTNNAQYISSSDNSIVATPTQSKYGKNYDLKLSKELQDTIKNATGKPIKITDEWAKNNMTANETDDGVTLGLTDRVLTADNFKGGSAMHDGITLEACSWMDENHKARVGWGIRLDEQHWLTRENLLVTDGSGLTYKDKYKDRNQFSTLDIDSTKLLRHDGLLGDETKGIKVTHKDDEPTSSISLTDDVWAKIQKIDSLSAGGGTTTVAPIVGEVGTITVTPDSNGNQVIALDPLMKTKIDRVDDIGTRVTALENSQGSGDVLETVYTYASPADDVTATLFAVPYKGVAGKFLATVTLECNSIEKTAPVTVKGVVSRWLSKVAPTNGYIQSGSVLIKKESNNSISVITSGSEDAVKFRGVFQVVLDTVR